MFFAGKIGEVASDLGEDDGGGGGTDAINQSEVTASKTPQLVADFVFASIAHVVSFLWLGMGWHGFESTFWRLKFREHFKDALVEESDFSLQQIVETQSGCEVEKMLVTPIAGQMLRDLLFTLLAASVTQRSKLQRVALAIDDGAHDAHPGLAGNIGHRMMNLHVHLVERLLYPLNGSNTL